MDDIVSTFITNEDFTASLLPTIEKALSKSPDHSLIGILLLLRHSFTFSYRIIAVTKFFAVYPHPLDQNNIYRILTLTIGNAKSTNAVVRTNSINLFRVLLSSKSSVDLQVFQEFIVSELFNLPKTGKSAGPDHRIALYAMLAHLSPAATISSSIVKIATALLAKEAHEGVVAVIATALAPHMVYLLREAILPAETMSLIAKEMNSAKFAVKKAFCALAGDVLCDNALILERDASLGFIKAVLPSFENCLKTVTANPLNSNPFEGYVAVAVFLGPVSRSGKFGA